MKTLTEDDYEEMAAAFQCLQIQTLYKTLEQNGVDADKIRKICEDYTFSLGVFLDQYWLQSGGGKVFPVVGFTKTHPQYHPKEIYQNNGMFSFSEYAMGNISWFFEENEPSQEPQKSGVVGDHGQAK